VARGFRPGLAYLYEGAEQAARAHAGLFIGGTALQIGVANADKGEYEEALAGISGPATMR